MDGRSSEDRGSRRARFFDFGPSCLPTLRANGVIIAALLTYGTNQDGKSTHDTILAQIIPGVESAFSDRKAKARWQGSVLHVKMEGDASKPMAGWSECRVLGHLLKEGETAVLEFPNGTLQCTEMLKER